jgi:hypothetical protein
VAPDTGRRRGGTEPSFCSRRDGEKRTGSLSSYGGGYNAAGDGRAGTVRAARNRLVGVQRMASGGVREMYGVQKILPLDGEESQNQPRRQPAGGTGRGYVGYVQDAGPAGDGGGRKGSNRGWRWKGPSAVGSTQRGESRRQGARGPWGGSRCEGRCATANKGRAKGGHGIHGIGQAQGRGNVA